MSNWRVLAPLVLCSLVVLSGCATQSATPTRAVSGESQQVRDAMKDGKVTYDEYRDGYERFAACMRKAGYPLVDKGMNRSLIDYAVPSEAADKGIDAKCYAREFEQIDTAWQLAHEDDSDSADFLRKCLTDAGITPAKTMKAMNDQIYDNNIDLVACMEKG
jgi:predicted ABC-class ATPase